MRSGTLQQIRLMVEQSLPHWLEALEVRACRCEDDIDDCGCLSELADTVLTIGIDDDWHGWGYQTGDPNYPGGAYGYHTCATLYIHPNSTVNEIMMDLTTQLTLQRGDYYGTLRDSGVSYVYHTRDL